MINNCMHNNVFEGVCCSCGIYTTDCGMSINLNEGYSKSHIKAKKNPNIGFFRDLNEKNIHQEVKKWIHEEVQKIPNFNKKVGCKNQTLFAFVYKGYLSLDIDFDPIKLAYELNISKKDSRVGIKLAASIAQKSLPEPTTGSVRSPIDIRLPSFYIEDELKNIDRMDLLEEIRKFAEQETDKKISLLEDRPNKVAIGFINYYCLKNNIVIPKIHKIFKMSPKELKKYTDLIE
uniref:Transcription factor TFIIB cyclin-like domain-containing protein n=1 Tax=viral metagenome TaxID=1070528 RepID=A0A6C0AFU4_9ZZZZ